MFVVYLKTKNVMNKALEIIRELGYVFIYVYTDVNDQYPDRIKTSDIEECSHYYQSSYDIHFSRN